MTFTICRLIAISILTLLAFGSAQAKDEGGVSMAVDIPYESFTLDNGLTVLVHTDHSTPTVFVGLWYGVGSKDEPTGKTGFAHLFEHLMFQGTANRDGEYFSPFQDAGATGMNGTTAEDRTNYFATVPSGALDMALWMESDRMTYLLDAVTQDALDEQRGVVKNEKRQRENQPYAPMAERIRTALYPVDHPYRHSVIGSMEDLDAASVEDVHAWFRKFYGASNVVLVLAGDVDVETAREKVAHYFSEAPAGVPLTKMAEWVPELDAVRKESMTDNVGQARVTRVWPVPGINSPDSTTLYLIAQSLAGNKNAPLRKKLVDELQLATNVSASSIGRLLSGEFHISVDLKPGVQPEQVNPAIDDVLNEYFASGPDSDIVDNTRLGITMSLFKAMESTHSIGQFLAEGELYSNDPLYINQQLARIESANVDDLRDTAARWLTRPHYELNVLPFPRLTSGAPRADRSAIPAVVTKSGIQFPEIEDTVLDNGMRLVVAQRGNTPLIDVSVRVDVARSSTPPGMPALSDLTFALLGKGTRRFDADELAKERDRIGMGGQFQSSIEDSSYQYSILESHLGTSLDLVSEMLRHPSFPEEELAKLKQSFAAGLANLERAPSGAARTLLNRSIFGAENPLGRTITQDNIGDIDRQTIANFHADEVTPDRVTVYMIGDIAIDDAKKHVESAFSRWSGRSDSNPTEIGPAPEARPRVILVDQKGAMSSTIMAGHSLPRFDPATFTDLSVLNAIIGGSFESRLNMNLREDKGWSYGYRSGISINASGDMVFATSGQVQTDKTAESMQEILRELEAFVTSSRPTAVEIQRTKLNRSRSLPGSFSTNSGFLSSIISSDRQGLAFDYAEGEAARLDAISPEQLVGRADELIRTSDLTWVVVGDLSLIEDSVKALGYGDVEVWNAFGERLR